MALREILVELGVELDKKSQKNAEDGIKKVQGGLGSLKRAALAAGAALAGFVAGRAIIRGFGNMIDETRALGDRLDKTREKLGVNAQALQELEFAAELAGASSGELTNGMRILAKSALEAQQGSKSFVKDFERLGVTVTDANGQLKPTEQLLTELGEGMAGLESDSERAALAQSLLGRSGVQLVPLLKQGTAAIEEQRKEARSLGFVMDDELIKASVDLTDSQTRLSKSWQGLKNVLARELLPVVFDATDAMIDLVKTVGPVFGKVLRGIGRTIKGIGKALTDFSSTASSVNSILLITSTILLALTTAAKIFGIVSTIAGIKAAAAWVLGMLPLIAFVALMGVLIAVIFLIIDDIIAMGEGHESVIGTMIEGIEKWIQELGGIGPAIAEMLKIALKFWLEFFGLTSDEADGWIEALTESLNNFWSDLIDGWADIFSGFLGTIGDGFKSIAEFASGLFGGEAEVTGPAAVGGGLTVAAGGLTGAAQAVAGGPAAVSPGAAGARTLVNQPQTNISVQVDASGQDDPGAIADMVASRIEAERQRENRLAMQGYTLELEGS